MTCQFSRACLMPIHREGLCLHHYRAIGDVRPRDARTCELDRMLGQTPIKLGIKAEPERKHRKAKFRPGVQAVMEFMEAA